MFLLRDVSDPDDAIRPAKSPDSMLLDATSGLDGRFYYQRSHQNAPSWVTEVNSVLRAPISAVFSASASGLLILRASGRFFAITFGYGKGFLDPSKIQRQFGLRVALNRIDPAQIRSMDTKTFEDMVVTKNTQTSKSSDIPTFGVDVSRDILRAVAGEPRDKAFAKRLAGSDALVLSLDLALTDVTAKCEELLTAYEDTMYRDDFEWIDHLEIVEDEARVSELDELLEAQLQAADTRQTHMATPEPIAWEDIDAFRISGTYKREYDDLDLDEYLAALGPKAAGITISKLKSRDVSIRYTRSGDFDGVWNVYQCLVSEQRIQGQLFALIEGRWFAISDTLVRQVDTYLATLSNRTPGIDNAAPGEVEPDYNQRMALAYPEKLLLLDAKIKRPGGSSTGIEFCDLLSASGDLIHVKRKSRSSTLSHLFAQGAVSATTFVSDGPYRDELRAHIQQTAPVGTQHQWLDLVPGSGSVVDKSRYTVCYVVLTSRAESGTGWLPFFSKLNLMQHGKQLHTLGFDVSLTALQN
ncbi:TIGR04141 family sporadically distributed protein [Microbacterium sp. EYE_5]|uniref:DUF6119 family protein n=1 Tax=unclassified Microbacterium TaxID=2609290 RepID=UPI002003D46D|nr:MULTISPECIES: DUF6119 family protein [unclassified Microbacterium]MCK6081771.1 TIGR04141 family sporadically distributed protein [Microbacterium sp. EYE_382]MCK6087041.1 TIGR04141 family sporadically distributed protein [Microbacterium sp. EYE_384]MCK6124981.1 TIGR04141 family sporadically distributed protein [Microbacterium sp. EYE_80]MCK6127804.1 TIGR04141 family sporadically distributed protein [Microbacterium sp. EYE_79]MCK6142725.1 TIGR04141 family sporadically distributed protein [Mic